jgi:hypothetical protein
MSLPARQQRVLDRIEGSLHACEPRLRSMFAMFTTLTGDEDMPRLEELHSWSLSLSLSLSLRGWRRRLPRSRRGRRPAGRAWAVGAQLFGLRAVLLVTVMLLALAPAVLLGLGTRGVSRCGPANRPQRTVPTLNRLTTCPPEPHVIVHQRLLSG